MRAKVALKDVGARKNGARTRAAWKYFFTHLKIKLWRKCLWVGISCWVGGIEFELATKA